MMFQLCCNALATEFQTCSNLRPVDYQWFSVAFLAQGWSNYFFNCCLTIFQWLACDFAMIVQECACTCTRNQHIHLECRSNTQDNTQTIQTSVPRRWCVSLRNIVASGDEVPSDFWQRSGWEPCEENGLSRNLALIWNIHDANSAVETQSAVCKFLEIEMDVVVEAPKYGSTSVWQIRNVLFGITEPTVLLARRCVSSQNETLRGLCNCWTFEDKR